MDGTMARKHHKPEEIVAKLPQVDVLTGQGKSIAEAVKTIAVTETTYFRWRAEYGGMKPPPAQPCWPAGQNFSVPRYRWRWQHQLASRRALGPANRPTPASVVSAVSTSETD